MNLSKMRHIIVVVWALVACACAYDPNDVQFVKSVKGGHGASRYRGGDDLSRFYNNTQTQHVNTQTHDDNDDLGVCYIEVPTASLVHDPAHIPTGNGSRSDLSRIRTCCQGYRRSIHNYLICEPVCSKGCTNALCIAPETCRCYPDYVTNLAGFCTATCPIGCQNGHCAGGECICNDGYKLDSESKFCIPACKDNCGGVGNCTAPNTCECKPGYQTTPDGSCKGTCDNCNFGTCDSNHQCHCHPGYRKNYKGICAPECQPSCGPGSTCVAPNVCSTAQNSEDSTKYYMTPITTRPLYPGSQVTGPPTSHSNNQNSANQYRPIYPSIQNSPNYTRGDIGSDNILHPNQVTNYPQYPGSGNSQNSSYPQPGQNNFSNGSSYQYSQTNISANSFNPQNPQSAYTPLYPGNLYPYNPSYPQPGHGQQSYQGSNSDMYNYNQKHQQNSSSFSHGLDISQYQANQFLSNSTNQGYPFYPGNQRPNNNMYPSNQLPYNPQYRSQSPNSTSLTSQEQHQPSYIPNNPIYPSQGPNSYPMYPANQQNNPFGSDQSSNQGPFPYYPNPYSQYSKQNGSSGYHSQGSNSYTSYHNYPSGPNNVPSNHPGFPYYPNPYDQYPKPNEGSNNHNYVSHTGSSHQFDVYNQVSNDTRHVTSNSSYHSTQGSSYPETSQSKQTNEEAVCSKPCINGFCVEGNECRCNPGYIPDRVELNKCIPHCPGGCPNGVCSAPRMCLCDVGYHKDTSVKGRQVCVKRTR